MIKLEGHGFNSHPGQSFPLSLCGPNSISRVNAHMVLLGRKLAIHIIYTLWLNLLDSLVFLDKDGKP